MDDCLYFLITLDSNGPIEINKFKCILSEENIYKTMHIFVFKYSNKLEQDNRKKGKELKRSKRYNITFELNDNKYKVSFDPENTFIYDVTLQLINEKEKESIDINQNELENSKKLEYFEKALKLNNENENLDFLYKDTIDLYSKKKNI